MYRNLSDQKLIVFENKKKLNIVLSRVISTTIGGKMAPIVENKQCKYISK